MKNRIWTIRKTLNLSQETFGNRLGVTGAAISRIEKGERSVTEQMILAICREFNVNEDWFRTGKGNIFLDFTENEFKKAAASLSNDDFARNLIIEYWKLDDDSKKLFRSFIRKLASGIKEEAMTLEKTPDIYETSSKEKVTETSEVLQKNSSSIPATVEKKKTVEELEEEYKKIHLKPASKKDSTVLNITDEKENKDKKIHKEAE